MTMIGGLRVVTNPLLTDRVRVEHDAPDRFIEYGPEDESWRRYFGFIEYRTVPSGTVNQLGDTLYMHPALWERLKQHSKEQPQ